MIAQRIANKLSQIQRHRLMEYVGGAQNIALHQQTDRSLRDYNLLRPATSAINNPRPPTLMLSELGREVVCFVLGQYADALHACGLGESVFTESQLSEAIKLSSRRGTCLEQIERLRVDADYAAASAQNIPPRA